VKALVTSRRRRLLFPPGPSVVHFKARSDFQWFESQEYGIIKFLYHLTGNFLKFRAENDAIVSLFKWREIRSISMYTKSPIEISKYLAQRGSYKLSLTINDLKVTPFLSEDGVQSFERLGVLFNWITSQASHTTAVFAHHLFRTDVPDVSVQEWFTELRGNPEISEILKDPADISAKKVDGMIKGLPPI
jgi:hypothetical protein